MLTSDNTQTTTTTCLKTFPAVPKVACIKTLVGQQLAMLQQRDPEFDGGCLAVYHGGHGEACLSDDLALGLPVAGPGVQIGTGSAGVAAGPQSLAMAASSPPGHQPRGTPCQLHVKLASPPTSPPTKRAKPQVVGLRPFELKLLRMPIEQRVSIHAVLHAVEEQIGPCKLWPQPMRKLFWSRGLNHSSSLKLAAFCMGNGLPPHLLPQWLAVRGVAFHPGDLQRDLKALQVAMCTPGSRKYFYWDLVLGEYCFMNGKPRNNITNTVKASKLGSQACG